MLLPFFTSYYQRKDLRDANIWALSQTKRCRSVTFTGDPGPMVLSPRSSSGLVFHKYAIVRHPCCWVRGSPVAYHRPGRCQGYNTQAALACHNPLPKPPSSRPMGTPWGRRLTRRSCGPCCGSAMTCCPRAEGGLVPGAAASLTYRCAQEPPRRHISARTWEYLGTDMLNGNHVFQRKQ